MIENGFVFCDCCGTEKLAQVRGDTLVIRDRRHGSNHVAVIKISDLLDILKTTAHNKPKDQAEVAAES